MQIPFRSGKGYTTLPAAVCRSLHPALRRRPARSTGSFPRGKGAGTDQNTLRIKHTCKIGQYAYRYESPPGRHIHAVPGGLPGRISPKTTNTTREPGREALGREPPERSSRPVHNAGRKPFSGFTIPVYPRKYVRWFRCKSSRNR